VFCSCPRDALCELCCDGLFAQLRGTAACRGERWADRVALAVPRDRAWPDHQGRAAEIARKLIRDLARDPRMIEMLAAELARWAARRWGAA
jgi:hypothetical protein